MEKSYVTLGTCPLCGEENGEILMDKRLRNTFEMHTPTLTPCDKCQKKYLTKGTMLVEQQSGRLVVLKDTAFSKLFNKPVPKGKICFVEEGLLDKLEKITE